jgi:DNA-binding protein HU-beta
MKKATMEQLVEKVMEKGGFESKQASREALDAVCEAVIELMKEGYDVALPGIGTLKITERSARRGRNPQTGEPIMIPAKTTIVRRPKEHVLKNIAS